MNKNYSISKTENFQFLLVRNLCNFISQRLNVIWAWMKYHCVDMIMSYTTHVKSWSYHKNSLRYDLRTEALFCIIENQWHRIWRNSFQLECLTYFFCSQILHRSSLSLNVDRFIILNYFLTPAGSKITHMYILSVRK